MHTVLLAIVIVFFAVCLIGAIGWCLFGRNRDPWPGWHQNSDPSWVNEISQPLPIVTDDRAMGELTGKVIAPVTHRLSGNALLARADRVSEETQQLLAVTDER